MTTLSRFPMTTLTRLSAFLFLVLGVGLLWGGAVAAGALAQGDPSGCPLCGGSIEHLKAILRIVMRFQVEAITHLS